MHKVLGWILPLLLVAPQAWGRLLCPRVQVRACLGAYECNVKQVSPAQVKTVSCSFCSASSHRVETGMCWLECGTGGLVQCAIQCHTPIPAWVIPQLWGLASVSIRKALFSALATELEELDQGPPRHPGPNGLTRTTVTLEPNFSCLPNV